MVEKATMSNILVDYDDMTDLATHYLTLDCAIQKATGEDYIQNIFLLSKDFIKSFDTQSKDNAHTETD